MSQIFKQYGYTGTKEYGGYFFNDQNPIWRDQNRIEIVEEMKVDPKVNQGLNGVKSPILASKPSIECDVEDELHEKAKQICEESTFDMPERSFKDFLDESLDYFDYGFAAFEKIYARNSEGYIILKDLLPLTQSSIQNWRMEDGNRGIVQYVYGDEAKDQQGHKFEIPIKKAVVFTYKKRGTDITGRPLIRSAYAPYWYKHNVNKMIAIALEKNLMGIAVGAVPEGATSEEKEKYEEFLKNYRANEHSFLLKPSPGYEFEIVTPSGNPLGDMAKEFIKGHNREILSSMLIDFMDLGSDSSGSFALSTNQMDFFFSSVEDQARYYEEQFRRQVYRDLMMLNFPLEYSQGKISTPKLNLSDIQNKNKKEYAEAQKLLADAGMLCKSSRLIQHNHTMMEYPELTQEEMDEIDQRKEEKPQPQEDQIDEDLNELREYYNQNKTCHT